MKTNAGTLHVCGGKRKQTKSSFTRPDWSFKPETQRAHTVHKMENQYVEDDKGRALSCIVAKKKDGFGYYYHIATITETVFDEQQGCSVIRSTKKKFKVKKNEQLTDWWIFDDIKPKKKRKIIKNTHNSVDTSKLW